jgi:hypothetical protein
MSDRQVNPITGEISHNESSKREQRRYEIARDCMAALSANLEVDMVYAYKDMAAYGVECADALLAELEKSK